MDELQQSPRFRSHLFSPRNIIIFLVVALLGVSLLVFSLSRNNNDNNSDSEQKNNTSNTPMNISPYKIVYGAWTENNSVIKAYDLMDGKEYLLASLPSNIKKVTVLDRDRLLYINDTDLRDHGQDLSVYTLQTQASTPTVLAADSFGIDDYVVSPNKQYVATWEVQVSSESGVLLGGRSRVYTANLANPSEKHLIYDEVATETTPVHYPRAILDDGTVFMDTFLPNSGAGWAYGMSVSNFTGTTKEDLANMQNGTYGTQPVLSPDGQFLAFAGYEGSSASGVAEIDGFRRALVTPNTIELLNTKTRERTKLIGISNQNTYVSAEWNDTGSILYTQIAETDNTGQYIYDITTSTFNKVAIIGDNNLALINQFSTNFSLAGEINVSDTMMGNLGETYGQSYNKLFILDESKNQSTLPLTDSIIQFIDNVPVSYLSYSHAEVIDFDKDKSRDEQIQLKNFTLKPSLAQVRESQQSERPGNKEGDNEIVCTSPTKCERLPKCKTLSKSQCKGKSTSKKIGEDQTDSSKCEKEVNKSLRKEGKCQDSPLYLYGKPEQQVEVKVHTPLFNSNAPYLDGYTVTLLSDGNLSVNGKTVASIDYDYISALRKISAPTTGSIVTTNILEQTLRTYAQRLGLNEKETIDLVNYSNENILSPYVFVSFYDHETSHAILPITFDPQPDTYRNIVFYFKQLSTHPGFTPDLPEFEKVERKGFTAIEVSGIVE